ncbi:hypothetical protein VPMG_00038 [Vibrio phage VBP32]|uniref:Uncharacterized protein n=2 Tax=Stoningtonvirus VBP47 TaxID=2846606 RepID=M4T2Q8_9CAUD|nr:hypothetical protein VPNG_00090 [Vibrio phage VBP47]YP_007676528.1 hypothetical protein VPMG_00038 [Vibrio phage VBP32]AGH57114.1 hypothetical protein VPNG_00090 [Vibrio phage VBP47]AGH57177.1 hypothetical protein VPMG_00038 [Vibrio phage VBP32]
MWKILHDLYGYRVAWNGYDYFVWDEDEQQIVEGRLDDWQLKQMSICIQMCHAELEYLTKSKTKAIRYLKTVEVLT